MSKYIIFYLKAVYLISVKLKILYSIIIVRIIFTYPNTVSYIKIFLTNNKKFDILIKPNITSTLVIYIKHGFHFIVFKSTILLRI